ncbi:DoxX family protein [Roseivirga sp. BDSF3-8]|uniref:DoxX family protein n=1 Tax=Roseivirga sp. BDSF3-8 TaxID=3241598 RepID=UPI0035320A6F
MSRKKFKLGTFFFYFMVLLYVGLGILHLISPESYLPAMATWLPEPILLIYVSGVAEIILGLLLIPRSTRPAAAWLIIAMLVVYLFVIHIPMAIDYADEPTWKFIATLLRIPLQFVLIRWAWLYTRPRKKSTPASA